MSRIDELDMGEALERGLRERALSPKGMTITRAT